jgi:AmmeMemoRadiSam system protein B
MTPTDRQPAVAGRFYPRDPAQLAREVEAYLEVTGRADVVPPAPAVAVMAPHAGYVFSGAIAGETYARVTVPERVVVFNPNHTGWGAPRSIWSAGAWHLPGGAVPVDAPLASALRDEAGLQEDQRAHLREHSGEVQLPFLRALRADVRVVPICLAGLSLAECTQIGQGVARAIRKCAADPRDVLLVASTDMSHFVSADTARRLDMLAIERMTDFDPEGLYEVVKRNRITMCGVIPTTVVLIAARELGASRVELVRYGNSGETSGDYSDVVGYAGAIAS